MCNPSPCQNEGVCNATQSGNDYICTCPELTTGTHCETILTTTSAQATTQEATTEQILGEFSCGMCHEKTDLKASLVPISIPMHYEPCVIESNVDSIKIIYLNSYSSYKSGQSGTFLLFYELGWC